MLGDAIDFLLPDLCSVSGLPRLPAAYRAKWSANVPALLISGTCDLRPFPYRSMGSGSPRGADSARRVPGPPVPSRAARNLTIYSHDVSRNSFPGSRPWPTATT